MSQVSRLTQRPRVSSRTARLRQLAFLVIVAGLVGLAGGSRFGRATATDAPSVQTDRAVYAAGDEITISGEGFAPLDRVTLAPTYEDGTTEPVVGFETFTAGADDTGRVTATWAIPAAASLDRRFVVTASSTSAGTARTAVFVRGAVIETAGTAFVAGQPVIVTGRGFAAGEGVTLQVRHADGAAEPGMGHDAFGVTAAADGTLWTSWTASLADLAGPEFLVTASGSTSGTTLPASFRREGVIEPDKGDYQPGETALLTGSGFAPGEVVTVQVVHVSGRNGGSGHTPFYVSANETGAFTTTWFVDPDDSLHEKFLVTAAGQGSGVRASATFWDAGTVSLTALGTAYTQDFNTLANTGTSNVLPTGWDLAEAGTSANANGQYAAGTGSGNGGDTYSFGAAGTTDRAFGTLLSGTLTPTIGASFTNNSGSTITSLAISYTGEMWRLGQNTAGRAADRLDFQYSTNATSLTTGTWVDVNALDFASPVVTGTVGALTGNTSPNRTAISFSVSGLSIPNNSSFWIRWADADLAPGADDGLAVDDFSLTPNGAAVPTLSINDVSASEGNSGITTFTFTVSLSSPAPAGGVTFDVTTADGTAQAPGDYAARSLTVQTIPAGSDTYAFAVDVTGDSAVELDEPFFVDVTNVTGANVGDARGQGTIVNDDVPLDPCAAAFTPVPAIQGSGAASPLSGQVVTTRGVVVGDYEYPGTGATAGFLRGFYLQDPVGDGNAATSDGVFVFNANSNSVALGDVVLVTGTVSEFQDQTQVTAASIVACGTGSVTPTDIALPLASTTALEPFEGMLVRIPQTLTVTEHFQLGRFGQVVLSSGGRLAQPTNIAAPGAAAQAVQAQNLLNRIILDDDGQGQNPDPIVFGRGGLPLSASNTLRAGDTATGLVGVLTYTWAGNAASGNAFRVRPVNALGGSVSFVAANPRPTAAPAVGGTVRVAAMNLLNFFNTFDGLPDTVDNCTNGVGGASTDCRGADTAAEFARQWPKTVSAILKLAPDVLGVNEIENDGYGPASAVQFLVDQLNAATAPGTYAFIDADAGTGQVNALGTDAIKVALLYKPAIVTPVGQTAALNTTAFVNGGDSAPRNRATMAQAFRVNTSGGVFIVSPNHLKSKGSACDAPDAGDGQGNCNQVRLNAALALRAWLATDPTGTGDPDVLVIGDLNSYALEDPVTALTGAGFRNLVSTVIGGSAYSYVFDGQWGYLDHALSSGPLAVQVTGVGEYHINADEPSVLDYNTDFKTANLQSTLFAPDEFRVSDHDPILVGLRVAGAACDVTGDGAVNAADLALLRTRNNQASAGAGDPYDANGDGVVNVADVRYCQLRAAR